MKTEFKDGFAVGFAMAVPECFSESLAKERLNAGDIIYNDRSAYGPWKEVVSHVSCALQVVRMNGTDITWAVLRRDAQRMGLVKEREVTAPISQFLHTLKVGV